MIARETARILSKGKSFEYSTWNKYIQYTNDCFKQDFVSYNNTLLICKKSHLSSDLNEPTLIYSPDNPTNVTGINSEYWDIVLTSTPGFVYIPEYDETTGIITWRISQSLESVPSIKITSLLPDTPSGPSGPSESSNCPWEESDSEGVSLGINNDVTGNHAVAAGTNIKADGAFSQAFGVGTTTNNDGEAAFGLFNVSNDDTLFSIGNGSDSKRQNVFEVTKDGEVIISGRYKVRELMESVVDITRNVEELTDKIDQLDSEQIIWTDVY